MIYTAKSEFEVPAVPGKKGGNVFVPFVTPFLSAPQVTIKNFDTGETLNFVTKITNAGAKFWGIPPGRYRVEASGDVKLS
jgi:hypothetical protein